MSSSKESGTRPVYCCTCRHDRLHTLYTILDEPKHNGWVDNRQWYKLRLDGRKKLLVRPAVSVWVEGGGGGYSLQPVDDVRGKVANNKRKRTFKDTRSVVFQIAGGEGGEAYNKKIRN